MQQNGRAMLLAFAAVTTLFFAWGFITSNSDPLIVALRAAFSLDYAAALLTQIVFFLAYGLLSLPAAWLTNRIGAVDMILGSLGAMACGCLLVVAATVLGVHFGSLVMLHDLVLQKGRSELINRAHRIELLRAVDHAFLIMAALLAVLLIFFAALRRFLKSVAPDRKQSSRAGMFEALRSPWAIFGALAIGLYVGAEVSVGSIMINFLNQPRVLGLPLGDAGSYLANFYWGGALCGRLIGTALLTRIRAPQLLASCGVVAGLLCVVVLASGGPISGYAALAIGFFNSIMFPTIFAITLERSGVSQSSTSGLLCVAIFGGALLPVAVGMVADRFGLGMAFVVPLIAYLVIAAFALAAGRPGRARPLSFEPPASGSPIA